MKHAILNSWQENRTFANDQWGLNYDVGTEIIYNTEVLKI